MSEVRSMGRHRISVGDLLHTACRLRWQVNHQVTPTSNSYQPPKGWWLFCHQLCCHHDCKSQEATSAQMWHRFQHYKSPLPAQKQGTHVIRTPSLAPKKGQSLELTLIIWLGLWRVCSDNLSRHLLQERKEKRCSQLAMLQHWHRLWEHKTNMSTPSKSQSSAMGDEGYFDWRERMERRQWENERQVQALLQETRRLREENEVLQIQASSSGLPRGQQSSQQTNSKQNEEATYPRNAEPFSGVHDVWPDERPLPRHRTKARTSLMSHKKWDVIGSLSYQMQCVQG